MIDHHNMWKEYSILSAFPTAMRTVLELLYIDSSIVSIVLRFYNVAKGQSVEPTDK